MATDTVPGADPKNADKLSRGCWAEHADGSLIYVKDIDENDRVIYEMYDLASANEPVYYPHALPLKDFEKQFSYDAKKKSVKWTWHDKTPFPWEKVMKIVTAPIPGRSANDTISAARRVAESLKLRAQEVTKDHIESVRGGTFMQTTGKVTAMMWDKVSRALNELGK